MNLARRNFIKSMALTGVGLSLARQRLMAAETQDYRALVCVFLYGGMDNHDTVIPYDSSSYNRWVDIRRTLISQYGGSRTRSNLMPLTQGSVGSFADRRFALPPELSGLHGLYEKGKAAIVGNVGPLVQPTTATTYDAVRLPPRLFSHNDQQALWVSSSPEGAQKGWGGQIADAAISSGANSDPQFTSINGGGMDLFLTGQRSRAYQVSPSGAQNVMAIDEADDGSGRQAMIDVFRSSRFNGTNLLRRDLASAMTKAYDANQTYNRSLAGAPTLSTSFPATDLGMQLQGVARTMSIRNELGVRRQVFTVGMGGFDTHDAQARALPGLHTQLNQAVTAFQAAMEELGLDEKVVLFTASDFGRTLAVNGDGTDHGWGGHHFVVGGSVKGRNLYGDLPVADFGHAQDSGQGRLIPTTSVEEFAAPMARWFGLSPSETLSALPNLTSQDQIPGFI